METRYHKDGSVTIWDVYAQRYTRTLNPSDDLLASLSHEERRDVLSHLRMGLRVGDKILAGSDQDAGVVLDVEDDNILVGWDQECQTWQPEKALQPWSKVGRRSILG